MTSTTADEELILKTDALGRVRMPKEKRELILDRFEQSGMSGQAFASWIQNRRRQRGEYPQRTGTKLNAPIPLLE
ncbi:hypothetical protein MLD52_18570, partial [Puniceicoccaceae bacterium K14]|nr:hypothetical protein [Puniceicoccaceae bacterium K14]